MEEVYPVRGQLETPVRQGYGIVRFNVVDVEPNVALVWIEVLLECIELSGD